MFNYLLANRRRRLLVRSLLLEQRHGSLLGLLSGFAQLGVRLSLLLLEVSDLLLQGLCLSRPDFTGCCD
jgi:hypothetical protein